MAIKRKTVDVQKRKEFSLTTKLRFSPTSSDNKPKDTYQKQRLLQNLLREFGLAQYLRVLLLIYLKFLEILRSWL